MNQVLIGRLKRQGYGLMIYRTLLTFLFLMAAFTAFPQLKLVVGLGLLVFNQAVAALGHVASTHFQLANMLDDEGERKTRHAILLAAERPPVDEYEHIDFWPEVNRRVAAETVAQKSDATGIKAAGLTAWNVLGHAFGDASLIVLAAILTPSY